MITKDLEHVSNVLDYARYIGKLPDFGVFGYVQVREPDIIGIGVLCEQEEATTSVPPLIAASAEALNIMGFQSSNTGSGSTLRLKHTGVLFGLYNVVEAASVPLGLTYIIPNTEQYVDLVSTVTDCLGYWAGTMEQHA